MTSIPDDLQQPLKKLQKLQVDSGLLEQLMELFLTCHAKSGLQLLMISFLHGPIAAHHIAAFIAEVLFNDC